MIGHYYLNPEDKDNESRTYQDEENELIAFTKGRWGDWLHGHGGWFCTLSKRGLCVVDFGTTKRKALRYARKAWRKEFYSKPTTNPNLYPRVISCNGEEVQDVG